MGPDESVCPGKASRRSCALALEHGLTVCSADTDFARFTEIRWHNPLA
jgi:hypothetical protein